MGTLQTKEYPKTPGNRSGQPSEVGPGSPRLEGHKEAAMPSENPSFCDEDKGPTVTPSYNQQTRATLWPDKPAPVRPSWRSQTS